MPQRHAQRPLAALQAAEQEQRRQAEGNRHDRLAQVAFVAVLMQAHARTGHIAIDQAGIRAKVDETRRGGRPPGQLGEHRRQHWPGSAAVRIERAVAIAGPIADPAQRPAVAQRHRHALAAGGLHVAQRRGSRDRLDRGEQFGLRRQSETT
ncbi:hypothetical protein D3C81_1778890 [compost metagenome]